MPEDNKIAQRVLEIVRAKGPVIPTQISKEIGTNSILASALLSELVGNNDLRISNVKIGGTPLYYAPGHKLQQYTKYLHEKEIRAYDLLKDAVVLRDKVLDPVMRVALRQIKDFAVPLKVAVKDEVETFWKWYMNSNVEAEPIIKKLLGGDKKVTSPAVEKSPVEQRTLKVQKTKKIVKDSGDFVKKVLDYFTRNNIEVLERFESKRKAEVEFLVSVPSPLGSIKYYCAAKNKKTCSDGDLSTSYVKGQNKKLPVLFLTTGKLTKSAAEMLEKEFSAMNIKQL